MDDQFSLFAATPDLPEGFRYQPDALSAEEERELLAHIPGLPLREFEFHGYTGKRRVVSLGWHYDFSTESVRETAEIPAFLLPAREAAARFAGIDAAALRQVLVTEYGPGAAIGWHRDKAVFGRIVGLSLLSPCTFRLRRRSANSWERVNLQAEPRSAYLLSGPARDEWEHSIPAVASLRYSITFRELAGSD